MNEIAQAIVSFFAGTDGASQFLGALALVGIAAAALIQAVKEMAPVRRWFQKYRVRRWLLRRVQALSAVQRELLGAAWAEPMTENQLLDAAWAELLTLTVDGDACALLDLPVEEMAVQMNAAMRAAVENPTGHRVLLLLGAKRANPADLELLLAPRDPEASDRELIALAEARSRVLYQMQRAVAGFEFATGYRWKLYLQIASFLVGAALTAAALAVTPPAGVAERGLLVNSLGVAFSAILAGFVAPVARDLTVVLKRIRDGRV